MHAHKCILQVYVCARVCVFERARKCVGVNVCVCARVCVCIRSFDVHILKTRTFESFMACMELRQ